MEIADNILDSTTALGSYPFPKDDLPLDVKESRRFGVHIGKAIWNNNKAYGSALFYNDRVNYQKYIRYALGKQGENLYHPFLGIDPNTNDKTWVKSINFQIKNYATKRVNIVVSKILSKEYDVEVSSIDPTSIDSREDAKARLQVYQENKDWFDAIAQKTGVSATPEGVDPNNVPTNSQELELFMETDYKTIEEMGMELGIQHHLNRNKYPNIRAENAFNEFVIGLACVYTGMDENVLPELEAIHPMDLVVPYSRKPNYTELPYCAAIRWFTVPEFRKKAYGYLTDEEIKDVIARYSKRPDQNLVSYIDDGMVRYDDVNKIPVLLYNYRSVDTVVNVEKIDEYGNKGLYRKPLDYYARPKEVDKFVDKYGKSRKLHRNEYNSVYEGYWVIGSDYCFRQGRRSVSMRKRGNFSDDLMGFKIYAPNGWNGYIVSTTNQMIPVLDELQRYNLKVQQIVARAIPKGGGINLDALRRASLKWGGKDLSDQQKIEMFIRSGIFVFADAKRPGGTEKPFVETENGMGDEIQKYLLLIQHALFELDEIIGLNKPSSASTLPVDAGKGTTEFQLAASEVSLDYLYDTDYRIFCEVVETLGLLHTKSVKYGPRSYFDRIFGKIKSAIGYSDIPFDKLDYGYVITPRPSKQEWNELYAQAEKAYDKGIIRFSDVLYLREIKSIKQARHYLVMLENKRSKEQMQNSLSLQQANAQTQDQSIKSKLDADKELAVLQSQLKSAEEEDHRQTLMLEASLKGDVEDRIYGHEAQIQARKTDVETTTDVILESMDNENKLAIAKTRPKPKAA